MSDTGENQENTTQETPIEDQINEQIKLMVDFLNLFGEESETRYFWTDEKEFKNKITDFLSHEENLSHEEKLYLEEKEIVKEYKDTGKMLEDEKTKTDKYQEINSSEKSLKELLLQILNPSTESEEPKKLKKSKKPEEGDFYINESKPFTKITRPIELRGNQIVKKDDKNKEKCFWWFQCKMNKYKYSPISISIYINPKGVKVDIVNDNKNSNEYSRKLIERKEKEAIFIYAKAGEKVEYAKEIKKAVDDLNEEYERIMKEESVLLGKIGKAFETKKQVVLTGAPGTGKTWSARKYAEDIVGTPSDGVSRIKFVQFHPSFDYTDFVEGLKPVRLAKDNNDENNGNNNKDNNRDNTSEYSFVRVDGIFKKFCREIVEWNNKNQDKADEYPFFFIIDEINRADLSKVFGELMYCLDEDYRDKEPYPQSQYSYLPTYIINKDGFGEPLTDDVFKDGFYIPKNLYIIGTMNDIDRSVETFDFALRRRFKWIDVKASDVMRDALSGMHTDWNDDQIEEAVKRIDAMNNVISGDQGARLGFSDAFHIGPSYFKTLEYDSQNETFNWKDVFEEFVEPILREYTRPYSEKQRDDFIKECKKALIGKGDGSNATKDDAAIDSSESDSGSDQR